MSLTPLCRCGALGKDLVIRRSISEPILSQTCFFSFPDQSHSTDLKLSKTTIGTNENFTVTVTVHNTGSMDGQEVVQVRQLPAIDDVECLNAEIP